MTLMEELARRTARLEVQMSAARIQKNLFEIWSVGEVDLTADETAWDIPDATFIELANSAATVNIHGIRNGVNGRLLWLTNTQPGTTVNFIQNSGSASVGDRITGDPGNFPIALGDGNFAVLVYLHLSGTWVWFVLFSE